MSKVSVVRCLSYKPEEVTRAVRKSLELIGGMGRFVSKGDRVLIKPNMLSAKAPEAGVTTHPAVVEAVAREVKEVGGIPLIGDSPGDAVREEIKRYWEVTGIKEVAERIGAELVNFETSGVIEKSFNGRRYYIAKAALEVDVVINLPKLKTHNLMLFTGAIKNTFGTIPGTQKTELHKMAFRPRDFARVLVDIFSLVRPRINLMDAVVGMEGNGPASGNPRKIGLILASTDGVALDAVASNIIGYGVGEIATTLEAERRGIGVARIEDIEILGERLEGVRQTDFSLPSNRLLQMIPQFLVTIAGRFIWSRPKIDLEKCVACGVCVRNCPVQAITLNPDKPTIDHKKCICCFCCSELCPQNAVYQEMSWLTRRGT